MQWNPMQYVNDKCKLLGPNSIKHEDWGRRSLIEISKWGHNFLSIHLSVMLMSNGIGLLIEANSERNEGYDFKRQW